MSRRRGIGFAVAARLAGLGAAVVVHHHAPHDVAEYGGADDLAGATASAAAELADAGVLLNTDNPGPVNTGYLDDAPDAVLDRFPARRLGDPDDPARPIAWLVSDEGEWMVGQVLHSDGRLPALTSADAMPVTPPAVVGGVVVSRYVGGRAGWSRSSRGRVPSGRSSR